MNTISVVNEYVAGALSGIAGLVVGFPFDTTKVQIQIQPKSTQYGSAREAAYIINHQGLSHGFFRGLSLPLFSYALVNSVFFGVYSHTLMALQSMSCPSYRAVYFSGCLAAFAQLVPAVPAEVVKVVLQSQIPRHSLKNGVAVKSFNGPIQATRVILQTHGIRGLYRGLTISCLRDVPSGGFYFCTYLFVSDTVTRHWPTVNPVYVDFFAGGLAGVFSWLVVNPFDVVKSKMQADFHGTLYRNTWQCAMMCYRDGGLSIFMRGALVNCIRAFPVNAAIFASYKASIKWLNSLTLPSDET